MSLTIDKLYQIHRSLCHPGVVRMMLLLKVEIYPFQWRTLIKRMTQARKECRECKPQYYSPEPSHLVKATQPFERLNIALKGPLPSNNRCRFASTITDEYSRFPFAFPCKDVSAKTVVRYVWTLISTSIWFANFYPYRSWFGVYEFGVKGFSTDLQKGISKSRTTSYNPLGNGQVKRLNGTLWRAITLAFRTKGLATSCSQEVLLDASHSIMSLLCTATDVTSHERMFAYQRKSTSGASVPSWLTTPGPVLLKRLVRNYYDSLTDEVDLLEANPHYAHVRFPNGKEDIGPGQVTWKLQPTA